MYLQQGPTRGAVVFTLMIGLLLPTLMVSWIGGAAFVQWLIPQMRQEPAVVSASIPAPSAPTPSPEQVASAWVAQSPARLIRLGDTGSFTFKFRNAGSVAWVKGTPAEVRLGIVGDDLTFARLGLAEKWPHPLRPALQVERVVRPGELATFTFLVRGSVTGTFTLPVRPVIDGVTWLNAEGVHTEIVVQAG